MIMEEHEPRIGKITGVMMVIVAGFYDALQALLTIFWIGIVFNPIISLWAFFHFFLWFKIKGLSLVGFKKSGVLAVASILELTPASFVPSWVVSTIIIIGISRAEDRLLSKEKQAQLDTLLSRVKHGGLRGQSSMIRQPRLVDNIRRVPQSQS